LNVCRTCCPAQLTLSAAPATGTKAPFNVTISNTGNVHLRAISLILPVPMASQLAIACDKALPADIMVKTQMHCTGTFVFTLEDIEAGSYTLTANVTAANLAAAVTAAPVVITAVPVPQLEIDVLGSNCTKPPRARKLRLKAANHPPSPCFQCGVLLVCSNCLLHVQLSQLTWHC
jgi:hypothetical protein